MKNIFDYPNEASTHYIDPDYIGNDTEGFQKRIKELKEGTYKTWNNRTVSTSVNDIMAGCSKYHDAFKETWGENTIYKFWENPMVEFTFRLIEGEGIKYANSASLSIVLDDYSPTWTIGKIR